MDGSDKESRVMNMTKDQIIAEVQRSKANKVKLAITDIDGILRGKVIHMDKFLSVVDGGFGFCDVVFGWDANDLVYENSEFTGWHTGYPDATAIIDPATYRNVPWDNNIPFFLADFKDKSGVDLEICPRSVLKKVRHQALEHGFAPIFAQEFEWFNFQEDSNRLNDTDFHKPNPLTRGMFGYSLLRSTQNSGFFNDLFDLLGQFKVDIEGLHTETGPGVYEAAIVHKDILEAADRAVLFKAGAKQIGSLHGIIPTFMAKWNEKLPGCSGHIHQSLWKDGKNVFFDESDKEKMSGTMKSYLAGILHCLPEILPLYAPTINSFKRLVEGMWAPTTLTWAIDNRTVAVRALPGSSKSTRLELRVAGSDVNPYLAMAGSLASGLYGISHNLTLEVKPSMGNGYEDKSNGILPSNLWEATQKMKSSEVARELLGNTFVNHFTATREHEWRQAQIAVTDWELKRYFEVI